MKLRVAVLLCAAVLIPPLAGADAPHSKLEVGIMQAVFDFCSKADPKNDKRFGQKANALLGKPDRDDAGFKRGFQIMESLLDKVRKADAVKGCAEFL